MRAPHTFHTGTITMTSRLPRFLALSLVGITILSACGGSTRSAAIDSTAGVMHQPGSLPDLRADTGAGAVGMASASQMQVAVEANLRVMMGASGGQLQAMVPEHRRLVTSMIGQMNHEMGSMHTASSAAWIATRDSVNADLMRFPSMRDVALQSMLPGHEARLHRLMQMHAGMMGGMGQMMPNR